jgi:hypothetical protein
MAYADRLFDAMNDLCQDEPAADVVYALAMMYAKALKDQTKPEEIPESMRAFGAAVATELKYPRSRVNLARST